MQLAMPHELMPRVTSRTLSIWASISLASDRMHILEPQREAIFQERLESVLTLNH